MRRALFLLLLSGSVASAFNWDDVQMDKAMSGGTQLFKAAAGLSEGEEIQLGRGIASNLAARYTLIDAAQRLNYLQLVGQTLVRHSTRPTLPFHFGILKSSELNAFSTPGGYVFITEGLFNFLQDEAELAGVLAHEVTHVTHQHILKAIRKANLAGAGQDLAQASGKVDVTAYAPLSNFSINLLNNGLSRGDELDADQGGMLLAAQAGYDPKGLPRVIERLKSLAPNDPTLAHLTKTHPAPDDRLKALGKVTKKNHLPETGQTLAERFKNSSR
jgi:predicted Zn-dependent protease